MNGAFGRYELLELLGQGGMAEVFLARTRGPKGFARNLVIKRILPHLSSDDEFVDMFVAEAKLTGHLSHGNIVPIYEFGEVDGLLFLAMEHVEGTDLRALLKASRLSSEALPAPVSAYVVMEILQALEYAHSRKTLAGEPLRIVHRDVSPSNVLLSRAGEVKLCDFGIAKAATRNTTSGRLKGKLAYMSPEQASGKVVDARSDLFSVGVILWEMLAGKRLFAGNTHLSLLDLVQHGPIPPLPRLGVLGEERLRAVVERALERDLEKRFPDAAAFLASLRIYLTRFFEADFARDLREIVARTGSGRASLPDVTPSSSVVRESKVSAELQPDAPTLAEAVGLHDAATEVGASPLSVADEPTAMPDRLSEAAGQRPNTFLFVAGAAVLIVGAAVAAIVLQPDEPGSEAPGPAQTHAAPPPPDPAPRETALRPPPLPSPPPAPAPAASAARSWQPPPAQSPPRVAPPAPARPTPGPSPPQPGQSERPPAERPRPAAAAAGSLRPARAVPVELTVAKQPPALPRPPQHDEVRPVDPFALGR